MGDEETIMGSTARFTTGISQLDKLLGFEPEHADFIPEGLAFVANLGQIHGATFMVGMMCLAALFLMHHYTPKIPGRPYCYGCGNRGFVSVQV